jgi:hypothetical protein
MKFKTLHKAVVASALVAASLAAQQAAAAPVFTFTESAGFDVGDVGNALYTNLLVNDANLTPQGEGALSTTMSWTKFSSPKSALRLQAQVGGLTLGVWTTITTVYHDNLIIPGAISWSNQDIFGRFKIYADGGPVAVLDDTSKTTLTLTETPNVALANCAAPNPIGSPCDDFFTFTTPGFAPLSFNYGGDVYDVAFDFGNFVNQAIVDGVLYTGEAQTSSVDVVVMLTKRGSAPEPASLGLFGAALVGLGLVSRRKQNA